MRRRPRLHQATLTRILEEARQAAEQQQREINAVANGVDPAAAQAAQAAATAAAAQAAISQEPTAQFTPPAPTQEPEEEDEDDEATNAEMDRVRRYVPKGICLPMKRMKRTSIPACSMMRKRKATMTRTPPWPLCGR